MVAHPAIYDCWNCEGPGIAHVGSAYICPRCEVTWRPHDFAVAPLSNKIAWTGFVITTIDFSKPDAPVSPG
jgi:hypothetical protein